MDNSTRQTVLEYLGDAMSEFLQIEQNLSDELGPDAGEEACRALRKMIIEKLSSEGSPAISDGK